MGHELKCKCGAIPFVDYWNNLKTMRTEVFVRCPQCENIGPSTYSELDAVEAWNKQEVVSHGCA